MDDITGWALLQYENAEMRRSRIFAFRLVDDTERYYAFPKNITDDKCYKVIFPDSSIAMTGREINSFGIPIHCPKRYSAKILDIYELL